MNKAEWFNKQKIMVVVAHPDDEILGLGASMNRLIEEHGAEVHVVILGEGLTSRSEKRDPEKWEDDLEIHRANIKDAQQKIGYDSVSIYDFPDNRFDTVPLLDFIKTVEKEKKTFRPDIIFTHHGGDVNIDHQRTFEAVITACRPMKDENVSTIITFETPSGTEWRASSDPRHFVPNMFISFSEEHLKSKTDAMECYKFEKRDYPHPRSEKALEIRAAYWGQSVGTSYAEAFYIVRSIIKN
ncbi:PIG-L family deacetylase [Rhodohalobacter sp. WB101]|uniref:PIG-L family deacetylase n=2 Tax=Rhodohalobacter sulfatireducens TaxID=2911366 RepID=A0ABS9KIH9_9BACT|nr:PIG-L family deacetylase [Rhodohalobacter sulfatireducens]MCG2590664.1 PIG-L family deacetylase [Rhodohalobacter sulfatireducens]